MSIFFIVSVAVARYLQYPAIAEDRQVVVHRFFGVEIEPEARRDLLHGRHNLSFQSDLRCLVSTTWVAAGVATCSVQR